MYKNNIFIALCVENIDKLATFLVECFSEVYNY